MLLVTGKGVTSDIAMLGSVFARFPEVKKAGGGGRGGGRSSKVLSSMGVVLGGGGGIEIDMSTEKKMSTSSLFIMK